MAGGPGLVEFLRQVPGWRKHGDSPPYIACLALTVLAASRMASDEEAGVHGNDYYARLNPLLYREPSEGQPSGFEQLARVWADLASWLDDDLGGTRGGDDTLASSQVQSRVPVTAGAP